MERLELDGEWQFRAVGCDAPVPAAAGKTKQWMRAVVPGTVHTDLMTAGVISDPFIGRNELDVQWVERGTWCYRRTFHVAEGFLRHKRIFLCADGLDTFAHVTCNGMTVGDAANMFIGHRWEIKKHLKEGTNILEITFDSPVRQAKALEAVHGVLNVALEPHRVYTRKAQYSYGWDWGPKLTTSGIWRGIRLEASDDGELLHPRVAVVQASHARAILEVSVDVASYGRLPLSVHVRVAGTDAIAEKTLQVRKGHVRWRVTVIHPELWWPNGYGSQPLYTALFSLIAGGEEIQQTVVSFGIRTIRLVQEKDADGRSFVLEVNGVKIFAKGANWIPNDSFLPRVQPATYEYLLRAAQECSMNILRVWGGGVYENDLFYDMCDRLGLLVWQDFMYACGEYPQYPAFLRSVEHEATEVVKRLRNHPCLALWCGNNECEWLYCMEHPGGAPDDMRGARIFRDVLPGVVRAHDGTRPYWRSSPFGEGFPNDERSGNHHQWNVWSNWKDYKEYELDCARFVTEFGFQGPANQRTMTAVLPKDERFVQSRSMEHHNKQVDGTERLLRFQAEHLLADPDFARFFHNGQFIQAEALKCAVEHWRRRKFRTAGSIFWQLNDCWPVSSWAVIDSALRPKAAYYYARRFFAPVLLTITGSAAGGAAWITNDTLLPFSGTLRVARRSVNGTIVWRRTWKVGVQSNRSDCVRQIVPALLRDLDPSTEYLSACLERNGEIISENRLFFAEPKHMVLSGTALRAVVKDRKHLVVEVTSKRLARAVRLEAAGGEAVFADNYFDLEPGEKRRIRVVSGASPQQLQRTLRVTCLR